MYEPRAADIRAALASAAHAAMEAEVSDQLNAGHYERTDGRRAYRNGYRQRVWRTAYGDVELHIPRLRRGTYYPSLLDNPRQAEQDYTAMARQALLRPLRSSDAVAVALSAWAKATRAAYRAEGPPGLWLDVLPDGLAVAVGVHDNGERLPLHTAQVPRGAGVAYWRAFLRELPIPHHITLGEGIDRRTLHTVLDQRRQHPTNQFEPAIGTQMLMVEIGDGLPLALLSVFADAELHISAAALRQLRRIYRRPSDAVAADRLAA